jgi:glycerol-3-phosphate acyltransferase PlsY
MKEYKLRIGVLAEMSFLIVLSLVLIGILTYCIIKDIVSLNSYWEFIILGIFIAIFGIYDETK